MRARRIRRKSIGKYLSHLLLGKKVDQSELREN